MVFFLAVAMAVVGVGTTYYWLRLARIPSYVAGVFAPALTVTIVLALGYLYDILGIFWSGARVIPVLAVIGAIGAGLFFRKNGFMRPTAALPRLFWLTVACGWLLAVLPQIIAAPLTNPVQQWDPTFHMNAVWSINEIGSGRFGAALPDQYVAAGTNYPLGWHIFVALFSTQLTVVQAANASTFALTALWVAGAGVYTKVLFNRGLLAAPILAGAMLSMPADALNAYNQWPNAASVALMPGIAAVAIIWGRQLMERVAPPRVKVADTSEDAAPAVAQTSKFGPASAPTPDAASWGRLVLWVVLLLVGVFGSLLVHMTLAFNLVVLLGAPFFAGLWRLGRQRTAVGAVALGAASIAVVYWALATPELRSMGNYPRSGQSYDLAALRTFLPTPPYGDGLDLQIWLAIVLVLMLVGVYAIYSNRKFHQWPIYSFLTFAVLVFIVYAPDSGLRSFLLAPWYLDSRRIMAPENLAMVPLAALGFTWAAVKLSRYLSASGAVLMAVLLAASSGAAMPTRIAQARSVYDGDNLGKPGMATNEEIAMLYSLRDLLPEGAIVLGDPQAGAAYAQTLGNAHVALPQLTLARNPEDNMAVLLNRFNAVNSDPSVCEALLDEGIEYFYQDEDGDYYGRRRSNRIPGFYNVDTSTGFELVAEGGTARVYRITACNEE